MGLFVIPTANGRYQPVSRSGCAWRAVDTAECSVRYDQDMGHNLSIPVLKYHRSLTNRHNIITFFTFVCMYHDACQAFRSNWSKIYIFLYSFILTTIAWDWEGCCRVWLPVKKELGSIPNELSLPVGFLEEEA